MVVVVVVVAEHAKTKHWDKEPVREETDGPKDSQRYRTTET